MSGRDEYGVRDRHGLPLDGREPLGLRRIVRLHGRAVNPGISYGANSPASPAAPLLRGDRALDRRAHLALAGTGEVLVSRTLKDLVAGSGRFEDRGEGAGGAAYPATRLSRLMRRLRPGRRRTRHTPLGLITMPPQRSWARVALIRRRGRTRGCRTSVGDSGTPRWCRRRSTWSSEDQSPRANATNPIRARPPRSSHSPRPASRRRSPWLRRGRRRRAGCRIRGPRSRRERTARQPR